MLTRLIEQHKKLQFNNPLRGTLRARIFTSDERALFGQKAFKQQISAF